MSAEQHQAGPYREPMKPPPAEGDRLARLAMELELEEGERLLWAGRPPQGIRFSYVDIFLIPFSLLWGGFAIAWEFIAFFMNAPFFFVLWGLPFVIVGFQLMIGRFITDAHERANTYYGVTDQRALIVLNATERQVKSLDIDDSVILKESKSGVGSILFKDQPLSASRNDESAGGTKKKKEKGKGPDPIFNAIPNAREVYQIIKGAQGELREQRRAAEAEAEEEPRVAIAAEEQRRVATAAQGIENEEQEREREEVAAGDRVYRA